jgi:peptidoglycan/xylan/chitin deacetylase (PgdA/CDA1 family)
LLIACVLGLGFVSCGDDPARPFEPQTATENLTLVVSGLDRLSAQVATEVGIAVRVEDGSGTPRAGVVVTWSVESGGGEIVSATQSMSDGTGRAAASWRVGTGTGSQRASASIATLGAPAVAEFVVDAQPGETVLATLEADSVLLSARGETVYLAPAFYDAYGNAAMATDVTWTSSDPAVATAAPDGLVTGQGTGTAYVTGSLGDSADSLLVTVEHRGAITVTFDDGWRTTYTEAFPVMKEFGFPANVAVNPGTLTYSAYMGLSHLQELHEAGWSMVSHTMNHARLTELTVAEMELELRRAKEFLDEQGFRGTDVFVVPYHDWTERERNIVSRHHRAARGVSTSLFPTDSLVSWMPSLPYDLTGMEADSLPFTTVEGRERLRAMLQRTVDEGVFMDLFFHHMPPERVGALRETLAILDEFRDRVLPYHELYRESARMVW